MVGELKDCPFCGGKAEVIAEQDGIIEHIHCSVCGAHNLWNSFTPQNWNIRHCRGTTCCDRLTWNSRTSI